MGPVDRDRSPIHCAVHQGRRLAAIGAAGALLLAACGGGDDASSQTAATTDATSPTTATTAAVATDDTTPAPTTQAPASATTPPTTDAPTASTEPAAGSVVITSEDGNLTLQVDAADAERVNPTVRILDPAEWPPELGDADQLPGVTIYEMGPSGAQFDEPVVVTRRIDAASFGDGLDAGSVPLVVPFTQESDGRFVPLDDLAVTRVGDDVFASGTTVHFSPLGTLDIQIDVRFVDVEETSAPPTELIALLDELIATTNLDDAEIRYDGGLRGLPEGPLDDITGTAGRAPEIVSRAATPPDGLPEFEMVAVEELVRTPPNQTSDQDARSLYSLLTSSDEVPSSPLFAGPDGQVPEALQIAVSNYILAVDRGAGEDESARLREIAEDLAASACLEFQVLHTPLGPFPSFSRVRVYKTPDLDDGERLLAALYTGEFGPQARAVDVVEMEPGEDGFTADVGLTSFGDVNQALFVVPADSPAGDMTPQEFFDDFFSLPGDVMALFVPDPFTVTADEGVLFDGDPGFQVYPGP